MASRAEKKGMVPEVTRTGREDASPRHAAKKDATIEELLRQNLRELTATVGAHCTRLDRHDKKLDDLDRRVRILEGKALEAPSEAAKEAEEEAATKAESEADKAEAPKPETTNKVKPEADKVNTDLVKPCFDDAPAGCYDIIYVYEHEHANRLTGKIERRWKKTFSEAMQASNGKYLGKRRAWVDRQGNYLRYLTPEEIERYYPGGEVR